MRSRSSVHSRYELSRSTVHAYRPRVAPFALQVPDSGHGVFVSSWRRREEPVLVVRRREAGLVLVRRVPHLPHPWRGVLAFDLRCDVEVLERVAVRFALRTDRGRDPRPEGLVRRESLLVGQELGHRTRRCVRSGRIVPVRHQAGDVRVDPVVEVVGQRGDDPQRLVGVDDRVGVRVRDARVRADVLVVDRVPVVLLAASGALHVERGGDDIVVAGLHVCDRVVLRVAQGVAALAARHVTADRGDEGRIPARCPQVVHRARRPDVVGHVRDQGTRRPDVVDLPLCGVGLCAGRWHDEGAERHPDRGPRPRCEALRPCPPSRDDARGDRTGTGGGHGPQ